MHLILPLAKINLENQNYLRTDSIVNRTKNSLIEFTIIRTQNIGIIIMTSRVPVEGKSPVCVICMK